ncbi:MAG TPA: carbon-nitrogen hydrolase family protein [Flavilitoribacter sp.]|nr:carbon-nitrogen hydrolase family protein [Flavilitoribacter sp.]
MRLCAAQIQPAKGNIAENIGRHKRLIDLALKNGAELILFPELSVTGYEPDLAADLACDPADPRLAVFQDIADHSGVILGIGLPERTPAGIRISMILFQPGLPRTTYSKQRLHADELPFFVPGTKQVFLTVSGHILAPAICYESLLPEHAEAAAGQGANVYLASVAKSAKGVEKAFGHYPQIARKYGMSVLMSNCTGPCDNFAGAGGSAIWLPDGALAGQLDAQTEGILLLNTKTLEIAEDWI